MYENAFHLLRLWITARLNTGTSAVPHNPLTDSGICECVIDGSLLHYKLLDACEIAGEGQSLKNDSPVWL